MRRVCLTLAVALLGACEPMNPSGDVFAPARVAGSAPSTQVDDAPEVAHDGFVFDAQDPDAAESDTDAPSVDDVALFEEMGLGSPSEFQAEDELAAEAEAGADPTDAVPTTLPDLPISPQAGAMVSGLAQPISWGVRLVSTTHMAQPPRGILGLPDGTERVVKPGDLLPEAGVIVLAVGKNRVQIAQVTPMGDHAGVQSAVLEAMYPSE